MAEDAQVWKRIANGNDEGVHLEVHHRIRLSRGVGLDCFSALSLGRKNLKARIRKV